MSMSFSNVKGALYSYCLRLRLFFPRGFYCYFARFLMREHEKHYLVLTPSFDWHKGKYLSIFNIMCLVKLGIKYHKASYSLRLQH
jgi:hypothetical protein